MRRLFFVLICFLGEVSWAQTSAPPVQIMGAADLVGQWNSDSAESEENRLSVRSAEISLYAPVDHLWNGVLTFAGHNEGGRFIWDIHEAYVQNSGLLPRTQIRVGKFLLGIGRLNQFHQHDWPFTFAPKVQRSFFADEAAMDTGVQVTHVLPTENYQDVTVGVTNGYCYGHCDQLGRKPLAPLHYVRWGLGSENTLTGLNYWAYTDFSGERVWHTGVDFTWKDREGTLLKNLVQTETYYRNRLPAGLPAVVDAGTYFYYQRGLDEQWSAGARLDLFSELNRRWELVDQKRDNLDYGLNLLLTYKASEFSLIRFGYGREVVTQAGTDMEANDRLEFQLIYLLGSHPAHDF